ncbi:MAG: hypothetical protein H0T89_15545 [Deltaproteobacteria bacterium]|nr:hypothetical protein [Deltaproteobacteria bacterium]MDQ3298756.1 hypothetical protein [Myxococcota bacterium]
MTRRTPSSSAPKRQRRSTQPVRRTSRRPSPGGTSDLRGRSAGRPLSPPVNSDLRDRSAGPPLSPTVNYLGFTCFRLESYDEPDLDFAFRKLQGTRNAMGLFATRKLSRQAW